MTPSDQKTGFSSACARGSVLSLDWDRIVDAVGVQYASAMASPGQRAAVTWKPALPVG